MSAHNGGRNPAEFKLEDVEGLEPGESVALMASLASAERIVRDAGREFRSHVTWPYTARPKSTSGVLY